MKALATRYTGPAVTQFVGNNMIKVVLGVAAVVLLIASTTVESTALRHRDWPNGGTCMGGPRDGKMVRDLKFCKMPVSGAKGRRLKGRPG